VSSATWAAARVRARLRESRVTAREDEVEAEHQGGDGHADGRDHDQEEATPDA
jgi:hypothetical protein